MIVLPRLLKNFVLLQQVWAVKVNIPRHRGRTHKAASPTIHMGNCRQTSHGIFPYFLGHILQIAQLRDLGIASC